MVHDHVHYTPKRGTWLDSPEIEFGGLSRQCFNRRIPDQKTLENEMEDWDGERNKTAMRVDRRFINARARKKIKITLPVSIILMEY